MRFRFTFPHVPSVLGSVRVEQVRGFPRPPSLTINARHSRSSTLSQLQMSISNDLGVIFALGQYLANYPVVACWLQFGILLCPFCNLFSFFVSPAFCVQDSGRILSGLVVFSIFVGLPFDHLYPSGSLVGTIWNLVVPIFFPPTQE